MKMKLTKTVIDNAPIKASKYVIWDTEVKGFGLVIYASGERSFVFDYWNRFGVRKRPTVAQFGVLTVEEARKKAAGWSRDVALGKDPAARADFDRNSMTIEEFYDKVWEPRFDKMKLNTRRCYKAIWNKHITPALGKKRIMEVRRRDIEALRPSMEDTPAQFNQVVSHLSSMFQFMAAMDPPLRIADPDANITLNPTEGVDRYTKISRNRSLSLKELIVVGQALRTPFWRGTKSRRFFAALIKLLLLTGARRSEWAENLRANLDLANKVLKVDEHKTSRRRRVTNNDGGTNQPKYIVLSDEAIQVITTELMPIWNPENPYIIQGTKRGRPFTGFAHHIRNFLMQTGITNFHIHDARHTFGSIGLSEAEVAKDKIQALLHHQDPSATEIYAQHNLRSQHKGAAAVASVIGAHLNGIAKSSGAA